MWWNEAGCASSAKTTSSSRSERTVVDVNGDADAGARHSSSTVRWRRQSRAHRAWQQIYGSRHGADTVRHSSRDAHPHFGGFVVCSVANLIECRVGHWASSREGQGETAGSLKLAWPSKCQLVTFPLAKKLISAKVRCLSLLSGRERKSEWWVAQGRGSGTAWLPAWLGHKIYMWK